MTGFEARSARWSTNDKAKRVAASLGEQLVRHMKAHGYSERELCATAGISRTTWRRATGRPFPHDDPEEVLLLSVRDFIAAANEMKLDPIELLRNALDAGDGQSAQEDQR